MSSIVNLSGGKDSTAMLLMMLERGKPIHSVVHFDTGWEFPQMFEHFRELERNTGIEIIHLKARKSFDYWMFDHTVIWDQAPKKGEVRFVGSGWPSPLRRWCTREKINRLRR